MIHEEILMSIIAASGETKANLLEALKYAESGDFEAADSKMEEAQQTYLQAHVAHAKLLAMSCADDFQLSLLTIHAEDQMMSCETIQTLVEALINMLKKKG